MQAPSSYKLVKGTHIEISLWDVLDATGQKQE